MYTSTCENNSDIQDKEKKRFYSKINYLFKSKKKNSKKRKTFFKYLEMQNMMRL